MHTFIHQVFISCLGCTRHHSGPYCVHSSGWNMKMYSSWSIFLSSGAEQANSQTYGASDDGKCVEKKKRRIRVRDGGGDMLGLKGDLGQRLVGKREQAPWCIEEGGSKQREQGGQGPEPQGAQQVGGRGWRGRSSGSGKCEEEGEDAESSPGRMVDTCETSSTCREDCLLHGRQRASLPGLRDTTQLPLWLSCYIRAGLGWGAGCSREKAG